MESIDPDPLPEPLMVIMDDLFTNTLIDEALTFIALLLLLLCSALISGSETAFFSMDPIDLDELKSRKSKASKKVLKLLSRPKYLLATILIANNFINVAIVIISTFFTTFLIDENSDPMIVFLLQVVLITSVLLLFGEIIPKILANKKSVKVSLFMASSLDIIGRIFKPISSLLVSSTNIIDKRFGEKGHNITMSDLSEAIEMTIDENAPEEEKMILKGIANFGEKEASEIMQSRMDVLAIDETTDFEEVMARAIDSGFSRIPVYKDTMDNVLGILYIKDLLPYLNGEKKQDWIELLRPVFYVPENKRINDLLQDFRLKKTHLAIVVDEYGGTSGIITLEDIIEEIVGEISDEFDDEEQIKFTKINDDKYVFEAKIALNDLCKIMEIDDDIFDEVKGESDSLGGLLLELEGKFPEKNSFVKYNNFSFKVIDMDERRIKEVEVEINKWDNDTDR